MSSVENVRELPLEYKNTGYLFKQIFRGHQVAIYKASDDEDPNSFIYEIFKIKIAKEQRMPNGVVIPTRERIPGKEDFGDWAWCPVDLKSAINRALKYENDPVNIDKLKSLSL